MDSSGYLWQSRLVCGSLPQCMILGGSLWHKKVSGTLQWSVTVYGQFWTAALIFKPSSWADKVEPGVVWVSRMCVSTGRVWVTCSEVTVSEHMKAATVFGKQTQAGFLVIQANNFAAKHDKHGYCVVIIVVVCRKYLTNCTWVLYLSIILKCLRIRS